MKPCDENIKKTLDLVEEMIRLAERGDLEREDIGCGILYGILRDSAFKIKKIAQQEKENHIKKGWWGKDQEERTSIFADNCSWKGGNYANS